MRSLAREMRTVWVSSYAGKTPVLDEQGRLTGEYVVARSKPFPVRCTLSPNGGNTYADGFGWGVSYDRTLISYDIDTGITEDSVVWVDCVPELDKSGELVVDENGLPTVPWDYAVGQVAVSYEVTNVALRKVEVKA